MHPEPHSYPFPSETISRYSTTQYMKMCADVLLPFVTLPMRLLPVTSCKLEAWFHSWTFTASMFCEHEHSKASEFEVFGWVRATQYMPAHGPNSIHACQG
eukprot:gnl/TRDRNA2_/TRDRNA2_133142_c1_seq1.p1 gnl/TRDRNA2_/TRDRNA2_133142_c1~~gnl/TRDRNA2_/TRDRNA2_133142_c1_seq1.p1  ORF type:complete len:100 (-),score=1.26 gnl/TRDRNA2_/TRDRNA2_133142_c1_seq1:168-467(-)